MKPLALQAIAAALAVSLANVTPAPAQDGDEKRGRKLAEQHCSRCHVVGDYNPTGGIASTPSFQLLVRRRPDYQDRFLTFFARRPHPAFITVKGIGRPLEYLPENAAPVEITEQEVADIAAFVETLKPPPDAPKQPFAYKPRPKPRMR